MSQKHILLIDDEEHIRTVVQACLVNLGGWTVSIAESGPQGLVIAKQEHPDAILLDYMMPEMDGIMLLRELRQDKTIQSIPVVMLTARAQLNDQLEYAELDVLGVISKPFEPQLLTAQVANMLGW
ncbi:response regulator [Acaryochloris marina]|uniref:response regulator n=1 Tax=Acaryochloris marina TaxID=155978 RepID=UPI001BAEF73F|nr:response regulator [Acaryochloris marina]QUY46008.1 response regulator [Acaryochloris marina S15]